MMFNTKGAFGRIGKLRPFPIQPHQNVSEAMASHAPPATMVWTTTLAAKSWKR